MLVRSEKAAKDVKLSSLADRSSSTNLFANEANVSFGITFNLFSSNFRLVTL